MRWALGHFQAPSELSEFSDHAIVVAGPTSAAVVRQQLAAVADPERRPVVIATDEDVVQSSSQLVTPVSFDQRIGRIEGRSCSPGCVASQASQ